MNPAEWKVDREGWPPGPWDGEPDRVEWRYAGFPCLMVRNKRGAWCGYVGVPLGHPDFNKDYDDIPVDVHGGLTYSDKCVGPICHEPLAGEPDDVWWIGFDTAQAGDLIPAFQPALGLLGPFDGGEHHFLHSSLDGDVYGDARYVGDEVIKLASQLLARGSV